MRKIQKHLLPLRNCLSRLKKEHNNNNFWIDLDKALRVYFNLTDPSHDEEDALNKLLLEIGRKIDRFKITDGDLDELYQRTSILKTAFYNHKLKTQRPEISQEIKILTYMSDTQGYLTEKDQKRLDYLYRLRKKI